MTVHLQLDKQGRFDRFCVHLHSQNMRFVPDHQYYKSASQKAPDRLYCGKERFTRLHYIVSRNLWGAIGRQGEMSLKTIYEGVRAVMQTTASQCMVCGNHVGAPSCNVGRDATPQDADRTILRHHWTCGFKTFAAMVVSLTYYLHLSLPLPMCIILAFYQRVRDL